MKKGTIPTSVGQPAPIMRSQQKHAVLKGEPKAAKRKEIEALARDIGFPR